MLTMTEVVYAGCRMASLVLFLETALPMAAVEHGGHSMAIWVQENPEKSGKWRVGLTEAATQTLECAAAE